MKNKETRKIWLTIELVEGEGPTSIKTVKYNTVGMASVSAPTISEAFDHISEAVEKISKEMEDFKDPDKEWPIDIYKEEREASKESFEAAEKRKQEEKLRLEESRKVKAFNRAAEQGGKLTEKHRGYDLDLSSIKYCSYMDRFESIVTSYCAGFCRGVKFEKKNHGRKE